jgi:host factor-I protein
LKGKDILHFYLSAKRLEYSMNRKLIRPSLTDYKDQRGKDSSKKKQHPSYDTHAENYYYLKQMNKKTRMAIVLFEGETVEGYIEWYDKNCIKLNRDKKPNLLLFKRSIKYMYKIEDQKTTGDTEKKTK